MHSSNESGAACRFAIDRLLYSSRPTTVCTVRVRQLQTIGDASDACRSRRRHQLSSKHVRLHTPRCCGATSWLSLDSRGRTRHSTQAVSPATSMKHLVLMYSCSSRSLTPSLCYIHSSLSTPQSEQLPSVDHLSTIDTVYSRTDGLSIAQAHLKQNTDKDYNKKPNFYGRI